MTGSAARLLTGRRTKFLVLVFWLVMVAIAGPLAGRLTGAQKNYSASWLPGSAESTKVLQIQQSFQSPNALPAVITYDRPSGLTGADRAKAVADARALAGFEGVQGAPQGPAPSADGKALQTVVVFDLGSDGWQKAPGIADRIRDLPGASDGLAVHVTGPFGIAADSASAFEGIDGALLFATIGVVVVILLITYRSPMLWLLPVISAGVALVVAQALIYLLAAHAGLVVNGQSAGILTVLVFGAGTDYALLLVARYREELRRHQDRHKAMAVALHRAGPAIVASASTVIVGMLCLMVAETNSTRSLGPVAAIGVAVSLVVMVTLLPALLTICGRWIFWPVKPQYGSAEPTTRGFWARVGTRIARRPRLVWVTTALVLGVLSIGIVKLDANGLTNAESFTGTPDSVVGEQVITTHFPNAGGAGDPVAIVADAGAADRVRTVVGDTAGISAVSTPVVRDGHAYLEGTLTDPADSQAAYATVDRLRAAVHAVPDADAMVGGNSAINLDLQRAAKHDRNLIVPIVLAVVLVILMVLLRAIVAPLVLIATVVLSFFASLGASALIFDWGFGFAGADSSLPLFVFVFLVALGIDYNIFLMTRVHEESKRYGTRRGALIGLAATGGVITSAGAVLAGTFAVLGTLPLVFLAELGFAVAFGVLLDTIVVRSVLVTALNLDIGRHIWWPSKLAQKADVSPAELLDERPADRTEPMPT